MFVKKWIVDSIRIWIKPAYYQYRRTVQRIATCMLKNVRFRIAGLLALYCEGLA